MATGSGELNQTGPEKVNIPASTFYGTLLTFTHKEEYCPKEVL